MTEAHSILAPSAAFRWVKCPGSAKLSALFPEDEHGEAAAEGTAAHYAASYFLANGHWPMSLAAPNGVAITEEMKVNLQPYLDSVEPARHFPDGVKLEERIVATSVHPDVWGTADAYALHAPSKTVYLWDLKYGHGIVEAWENWQLVAYASALLDLVTPEWTFVLRIVQPRAFHRDGVVRTWSLTAAELRTYARDLHTAAHEAMGNNPQVVVGAYCKFCPARHACLAAQSSALEAEQQSFQAVPLVLSPAGLSLELSLLRRAQERLTARLTGLEAQALSEIRAGKVVPGWTIEHTNGREEWTKPTADVLALGALFGVSLGKPPEPITPRQARDAGVSADIIAAYSQRKTGTAKLTPVSTSKARQAFGG